MGATGTRRTLFDVLPAALLFLLIAAYALTAGGLALRRHANLESQALDMGYADQITWNMLHGRPFRFTVFRGLTGAELGRPLQYGPGADRDSLFAYHVELIYLPLSLAYLVHAGPETLIVVLTAAVAFGAIPAYRIGRRLTGAAWAGLALATMYLAFPSTQAANLSDFHPVSMAGAALLWTADALLAGQTGRFIALAVLSASLKEEVGLLVGMLGLYSWLVQGQRRLGLTVALSSFAWVALCFGVIMPHFTGGAPSLFVARYADAIHTLRLFPSQFLAGHVALLVPDFTVRHVLHMLAGTGFLALFAPLQLALAVPALAINGLSGSTWQHGGGAHYSAETVAPLILAAAFGADRVRGWLERIASRMRLTPLSTRWRGAGGEVSATVITLAALTLALLETHNEGILPPASRFSWPAPSGRAAHLAPLLAQIPPGARVSAQSDVYPHLSTREWIYPFPSIDDADYVLVDVAGTSTPLYPDDLFPEVQTLLRNPRFNVLAADDGFLLFHRIAETAPAARVTAAEIPAAFYAFARVSSAGAAHPTRAVFDGAIELAAYETRLQPEVSFGAHHFGPTLYFRAVSSIDRAYRLTTYLVGRDNVARIYDDGNSAQLWYPTLRWQPGELIRVQYPPIAYRPGDRWGAGIQLGSDESAPRLTITSSSAPTLDANRVALLGPLA